MLGAFVYLMSKQAAQHNYSYCGGRTWQEQCNIISDIWASFQDPVWLNGDFSTFDATKNWALKTGLYRIYNRVYQLINEEWGLDLQSLGNYTELTKKVIVGWSNDEVTTIEMTGRQASGDSNTSFDNSNANESVWRFILKDLGISVVEYDLQLRIIKVRGQAAIFVMGDDHSLIVERTVADRILKGAPKYFDPKGGLGFKHDGLKKEEKMDFCSTDVLLREDGSHRIMRKIKRFLSTTPFTRSVKFTSNAKYMKRDLEEMAWAEGMCMKAWCRHLPVFDEYANVLIRLGKPMMEEKYAYLLKTKWEYREERAMIDVRQTDYNLCLEFWEEHYQLSRITVFRIEEALRRTTTLNSYIYVPEIIHMCNVDAEYSQHLVDRKFTYAHTIGKRVYPVGIGEPPNIV